MAKPATLDGYHDRYTVDCERVLVTLLRGLGPWKESVFLVGCLTPRFLVTARPPSVPAHAGTLDVDIVIDLPILADTAGYATGWSVIGRTALLRWPVSKWVKTTKPNNGKLGCCVNAKSAT